MNRAWQSTFDLWLASSTPVRTTGEKRRKKARLSRVQESWATWRLVALRKCLLFRGTSSILFSTISPLHPLSIVLSAISHVSQLNDSVWGGELGGQETGAVFPSEGRSPCPDGACSAQEDGHHALHPAERLISCLPHVASMLLTLSWEVLHRKRQ